MKYLKIRNEFLKDTYTKFNKQYNINLELWKPNPYRKIKYIYNNELGSLCSFIAFKLKFTPNLITTINILLAFLSLLIFLTPIDQYKNIALIIIFSKNILDNVDGYIARKRKLISRFGDKLDLISGKIFYHTILLCLIFHIFHFNKEIIVFGFYFLILFLDYFNSNKSKYYKKKLFSEKKKITKKNLFIKSLLIFNYNGQTMITDIIVFILSLEIFFQKVILSNYLICIFLLLKILRNMFNYLKR